MARVIKDAYNDFSDQLKNFFANKMYDFSITNFEVLINSHGLNQTTKTLLLQKIGQLLEAAKALPLYANPDDILNALAESIKAGTVVLHIEGKFSEYKRQFTEVDKLYKNFIAALDVMLAGSMLAFEVSDFIGLLGKLNVDAKQILEEKIVELKRIFNAGELPTYGDPTVILEEISVAIQSTSLSIDFEENLQVYQEAYQSKSNVINSAFEKVYLPLNQLYLHFSSNATSATIDDHVYKLENVIVSLSLKEFETLTMQMEPSDKEKFLGRIREVLLKLSSQDSLKAILQLFKEVIEDPSQLDQHKPSFQEQQAKMKLATMVELYAALSMDTTELLEKGLVEERKKLAKSAVLNPEKNKTSYPTTIYASLKPLGGFDKAFITQATEKVNNTIILETAVNYIVYQYLLKRLEIANDSNEKNRTTELAKLQKALVDFVIAKEVKCGSLLHQAIVKKFWKILEPELANRNNIESTVVDALRAIAITEGEVKVKVSQSLNIANHIALSLGKTPLASPSQVKSEKGSEIVSIISKPDGTAASSSLAKVGSAESPFFGSPSVGSSSPERTPTKNISTLAKANEPDMPVGAPKKELAIGAKSNIKPSTSEHTNHTDPENSLQKSDAEKPTKPYSSVGGRHDDIFELELDDAESAEDASKLPSLSPGTKH
jgi:hypothetical protein